MNPDSPNPDPKGPRPDFDAEAADWIIGKDRGLTEAESKRLEARKKGSPDFKESLEATATTWERMQQLPADWKNDLLEKSIEEYGQMRKSFWMHSGLLGFAALLLLSLGLFLVIKPPTEGAPDSLSTAVTGGPTTQVLDDGTLARLNVGADLEVLFTPAERRVIITSGEAHFKVKTDEERPFVVESQGVEIVAVGTSFGVQSDLRKVDVIVTEGLVRVLPKKPTSPVMKPLESDLSSPRGYVSSGQRAVVRLNANAYTGRNTLDITVSGAKKEEVDQLLAWRQPLLTLEGDSLGNIAANFKMKTGRDLLISDPSLSDLKIGGRFSSDDPKRFLEILRLNYGIEWFERKDGTLVVGNTQ